MASDNSSREELDNEYMTKSGKVFSVIVPAGEIYPVDARGNSYFVIGTSSQVPLLINTEKSSTIPHTMGTGFTFRPGFRFNMLFIKNPNNFSIKLTLWAGFGSYDDRRTFVQESPCVFLQSAPAGTPFTGTFAALTSYTLTGVPPNPNILGRRSVTVSNLDPANPLKILDTSGNLIGYVPPVSVLEFITANVFTVRNDTGAPINGALSESWFYVA